MKYALFIILIFLAKFSYSQNPTKYMNKMGDIAKTIRISTIKYTQSFIKNKGTTALEDSRSSLLRDIRKAKEKVTSMPEFNGQSYYRDSVLAFLNIYEKVVSQDYGNIIFYTEKAEKKYSFKEELILAKDEAFDKLTKASEMFDLIEERFATENKAKLVKSDAKITEKLKKVNRVYKYYNSIFILFLQTYSEEAKFLEHLEKGDIEGMKESIAALSLSAKENLEVLNSKQDFDGDHSLIEDCGNLLEFYKKEADSDFDQIVEFQEFKSEFKKMKALLEAKPSGERTKEEVANYNKRVHEYNKRTSEYNDLIETLNFRRAQLVNAMNTNGGGFEKGHINRLLEK